MVLPSIETSNRRKKWAQLFVLLLALAATKAVDTSLPDKAYIKRLRQTAKAETRGHRQLYKDLGTLGQGGAGKGQDRGQGG